MKLFSTIAKGKTGEKYVSKYLKKKHFKILEINMRNKYSEIDIIAENKEYIVFVEVKTRTGYSPIRPSDAVNSDKQLKIMRAAQYYLTHTNKSSKQPRFDVAEVYLNPDNNKPYELNYIENAFVQGGDYAVL